MMKNNLMFRNKECAVINTFLLIALFDWVVGGLFPELKQSSYEAFRSLYHFLGLL